MALWMRDFSEKKNLLFPPFAKQEQMILERAHQPYIPSIIVFICLVSLPPARCSATSSVTILGWGKNLIGAFAQNETIVQAAGGMEHTVMQRKAS